MKAWLAAGTAVLAIALWVGLRPVGHRTREVSRAHSSLQSPVSHKTKESPAKSPESVFSPLAAQLSAPEGTASEDIRLVQDLFGQYRSAIQNRPGPPIGDNQDLVRVLTGRNPLKRPLLPLNHPAIDASGRLLDRWRNPYHIHALSAERLDVRSAGPDGQLFTEDDLTTAEQDLIRN